MTNLFINYYVSDNEIRKAEYIYSINTNLGNRYIDKVFIFLNDGVCPFEKHSKVVQILGYTRPTYQQMFNEINACAHPEDINILSNTDIIFDNSLYLLEKMKWGDCYALARWERDADGPVGFGPCSQDTWIFKGKVLPVAYADFPLGVYGCDNRIAHELKEAGHNMSNPSKSIRCHHIHDSNIRTQVIENRVPEPYLCLENLAL